MIALAQVLCTALRDAAALAWQFANARSRIDAHPLSRWLFSSTKSLRRRSKHRPLVSEGDCFSSAVDRFTRESTRSPTDSMRSGRQTGVDSEVTRFVIQ